MKYLIADRAYTYSQSLADEHRFLADKNYLFSLEHLCELRVEGRNAMTFLQGQLSCDMRLVNPLTMQQGVMCNLKGRILAIMDVIGTEDQVFSLILPRDICDTIQTRLTKPALLSQVKLHQVASRIYGLYVQNTETLDSLDFDLPLNRYDVIRAGEINCYKIDTAFYLIVMPASLQDVFERTCADECVLKGSLGWHWLQLQFKRVEIYPSSQGLFLPHRLDFHQTGYLSFDKGCYKGQEIIARMHYRSAQKYALVVLTVTTEAILSLGMSLYAEDGETPIGELIDYSPIASNQWLIAASLLISSKPEYLIALQEMKHRLDLNTP